MGKAIIVLADGSAVSASQGTSTDFSNVFKLNLALDMEGHTGPQVIFYFSGVGTRKDPMAAVSGRGLDEIIKEIYVNVASNYVAGDLIFLIGFSRGGAAVKAVASMISQVGLLHANNLHHLADRWKLYELLQKQVRRGVLKDRDNREFWRIRNTTDSLTQSPVQIEALGLFDAVSGHQWDRLRFIHRTAYEDGPLEENVRVGIQILSIDDRRFPTFRPLIWTGKTDDQKLEQIWMPGVHGDIGGTNSGLIGQTALKIMISRLSEHCKENIRFSAGDLERIDREVPINTPVSIANECAGASRLLRRGRRKVEKNDKAGFYLAELFEEILRNNVYVRGDKQIYDPVNVSGEISVLRCRPNVT